MQIPISDNVIVLEKEFKTKKGHTDKITCLSKISDSEFMTSSLDMSFKIWDKDLQGCRYTIETHEPLHTMSITGEKFNLLISGVGDTDFIVIGLEEMS
jgi:WD40 repeat protein